MRPIASHIVGLALSIAAQSAVAQSELIDGQVMKVDQSAGKITIKHGPAKRLGMESGMTMVYKAQDPALLKAVKVGNKIKFDAEQVNGQYRSEEHTSELQSHLNLVCRLLLEKKKTQPHDKKFIK